MSLRNLVFDTGVLLEILVGSEEGRRVVNYIEEGDKTIFVSELSLVELEYVVCRKYGEDMARQIVDNLLKTGYFEVAPFQYISSEIWKVRCRYPVSLGDSAAIALGSVLGAKVVFKRERELVGLKLPQNVVYIDELGAS